MKKLNGKGGKGSSGKDGGKPTTRKKGTGKESGKGKPKGGKGGKPKGGKGEKGNTERYSPRLDTSPPTDAAELKKYFQPCNGFDSKDRRCNRGKTCPYYHGSAEKAHREKQRAS